MPISEADIVLFWPSLSAALVIALVHLFAPYLHFMRKPDNVWVPASAGIALGYVFMDIFPHLAKSKAKYEYTGDNLIYEFLIQNIYLLAFIGFSLYLGVILAEKVLRKDMALGEITFRTAPMVVRVESVSLIAYNFLIGYLLSEQVTHRPEPAILFGAAMAIHFVGLDYLTRGHFPQLYDGMQRFAFAAAVLAGWLAGTTLEISNASLDLWYSFLAGGIIVVAAVYELPHIQSRKQYWAFLVGAGLFSTLILSVNYYGK